jgi:hypothetical protein
MESTGMHGIKAGCSMELLHRLNARVWRCTWTDTGLFELVEMEFGEQVVRFAVFMCLTANDSGKNMYFGGIRSDYAYRKAIAKVDLVPVAILQTGEDEDDER